MKQELLNQIAKFPIIPVFYHDDLEICKNILKACYAGGIRIFEFVNRGPAAETNFKALLTMQALEFPDLKLGIGTLLQAEEAERFIQLGAAFLVSPIFTPEIAQVAQSKQMLWIPGCMTPSEIAQAQASGCNFIKLFPGDTLGPNFLKSIRPLFPTLQFMPTGGVEVSEDNIRNWFSAGVTSVGLGSKLFTSDAKGYDYDKIQENCEKLLAWAKA